MTNVPAAQVCDFLARWADVPAATGDVLDDLDRRCWPSAVDPSNLTVIVADPGWGQQAGYFLMVGFDGGVLDGFTAFLPTVFPADPVPSAFAVGTAAQRLWGQGHRLGPAWLSWDTPHGRCEIQQADATVVSWWHDTGTDTRRSRDDS